MGPVHTLGSVVSAGSTQANTQGSDVPFLSVSVSILFPWALRYVHLRSPSSSQFGSYNPFFLL